MALTKNAEIVYICTDMGNLARETESFERFNSAWCAKMVMLSISKKDDDKRIFEAMKAIKSNEFYWDANR